MVPPWEAETRLWEVDSSYIYLDLRAFRTESGTHLLLQIGGYTKGYDSGSYTAEDYESGGYTVGWLYQTPMIRRQVVDEIAYDTRVFQTKK